MAANGSDDDQTRSFINLAAGTIISHYKIISKIGAGGMGEVYLAEDTKLDRKVALKFLPSHLCLDEASRERFTREAKAAAKLDHSNIVPVYEVGEFQGRPFFAMAQIEGKSLREVIKEGKLTVSEAINLTMQICEGLDEAHTAGIVHRDIKPGNIILDRKNRARLVDFGLATVTGEKKLTKTGSTLGTVGYMSPELVKGDKADQRTDLFSVGIVLYEMITGRTPFDDEHEAAIHYNIVNEQPEPMSRYKSGVSGELQQIIDRALLKDVSVRYQTASGMLADLKRLSVGSAPSAKSHSRPWIAITALVVVVIAGYFVIDRYHVSTKLDDEDWSNSIAVLVFRDLSPEKDQDYFCEGMTDAIIGRLSGIGNLKVTSLTSVVTLKDSDLDLKEIGKQLGVSAILEGTIQKEDGNIRVNAQLIEVDTDAHIWSGKYDRELTSIFAVQDDISRAIVDVMRIQVAGDEEESLLKRGTDNLEAYNAYMLGRHLWRKRIEEDVMAAMDYFHEAIELDSGFALAYVGLADCWLVLPKFSNWPQMLVVPKAKKSIEQALKLDDLLAEAHASRGCFIPGILNRNRLKRSSFEPLNSTPVTPGHMYGMNCC